MSEPQFRYLAPLFHAVGEALQENRSALNQADQLNGNHGDHMVAVFQIAARAAEEKPNASLAEAMEYASGLLEGESDNGSARLYALGLRQMAAQLSKREISLDELIVFVQWAIGDGENGPPADPAQDVDVRKGEVLKALLAGLASWGRENGGELPSGEPLNMSALFEFGMAYMQARQRNSARIDILADAAASASPLGKTPHRYQSGVIVIRALLQAMKDAQPGRSA